MLSTSRHRRRRRWRWRPGVFRLLICVRRVRRHVDWNLVTRVRRVHWRRDDSEGEEVGQAKFGKCWPALFRSSWLSAEFQIWHPSREAYGDCYEFKGLIHMY